MKFRFTPKIFLFFILFLSTAGVVLGWGSWGHQHINRGAVLSLPKNPGAFFFNHIDFLTIEADVPDLRKYTINDKAEFPRHFIDLENYGNLADSLPRTMAELKKKYDEKALQQNGILPWYIQEMMEKLTKAMKDKRKTEILFLAADLGHYLGDAHMPLHTSVNHNGQLTGQQGIHAFFEAQLPELFGRNYRLHTREAKYIPDVEKETWNIILHSFRLADTVLKTESALKQTTGGTEIYVTDSTGNPKKNKFNQPVHAYAYAQKYHEALKGMVERQLRAAVIETADFWYTAWVNADRPDLESLDEASVNKSNTAKYQQERQAWLQGKLTGIHADNEFTEK